MPGKHVRFSTQNIFHSPVPELSHSVSSDNASSVLFTPPSHAHVNLPGPTPYVPRRSYTDPSAGKARAHNLLAYSSAAPLPYDLSLHPSSISAHHPGLSLAGMSEPAVYPPQPTITIGTPHLPWSFSVQASNRRYVTVADVVSALYHGLRSNITPAEFQNLGNQKLMRRVTAAYTARYTRFKGHRGYAEEKASGVKRVDFLMGCNQFHGLTPTTTPGVWRLHVA